MTNKENKPIATQRAGSLSVTAWNNKNKNKDGKEFDSYSFVISRGYKDGEEWKSTNSIRLNDIPKVIMLLEDAFRDIVKKSSDDE